MTPFGIGNHSHVMPFTLIQIGITRDYTPFWPQCTYCGNYIVCVGLWLVEGM